MKLFDFTNDSYGLKASLFFVILLILGMIIWSLLGFDSGSGGSPYGNSDSYFNEE